MIKLIGKIPYGDYGDDEFISRDTKMGIPEEGIVLKHDDHEICTIKPPDVEIVTDNSGIMLYINLPLTENNRKWMRDNPMLFSTPD